MTDFTKEEIEVKIDIIEKLRANLKIMLPFKLVQKTFRAVGVKYEYVDSFSLAEYQNFKVLSNLENNEITLSNMRIGRMVVMSQGQFKVVHRLYQDKKIEFQKMGKELDKLSTMLDENEAE